MTKQKHLLNKKTSVAFAAAIASGAFLVLSTIPRPEVPRHQTETQAEPVPSTSTETQEEGNNTESTPTACGFQLQADASTEATHQIQTSESHEHFDMKEILKRKDFDIYSYEEVYPIDSPSYSEEKANNVGQLLDVTYSPDWTLILGQVYMGDGSYDYFVKNATTKNLWRIRENGHYREFDTGWLSNEEIYIWTSHGTDCASSMKAINIFSGDETEIYSVDAAQDIWGCLVGIFDNGNTLAFVRGTSIGQPGIVIYNRQDHTLIRSTVKTEIDFGSPFPITETSPNKKFIFAIQPCEDYSRELCIFVYNPQELLLYDKVNIGKIENFANYYNTQDEPYSKIQFAWHQEDGQLYIASMYKCLKYNVDKKCLWNSDTNQCFE